MFRLFALAAAVSVITGCSIKQTVIPAQLSAELTPQICMIPAEGLRAGFNSTYKTILKGKGFSIRELSPHTSPSSCPLATTYTGQWGWDFALYMKYADIRVYEHGRQVGHAEYDSRWGGGRLDKFIDAETKITELADQLFPNGATGLGVVRASAMQASSEPTRNQQLQELYRQQLPYEEYQARYREIMSRP